MYVKTISPEQVLKTDPHWYGAFDPLLDKRWRHIGFEGGRGSLKSTHFGLALLNRGQSEKLRILCVREIQISIKDSVHKLLKDLIEIYNFKGYMVTDQKITNINSGTEINFKGLFRNENTIKSFEGIDIVWVEEAQAVSMLSLDYLIPTIRKDGSQLWYSFNRFADDDPVWEKIFKNPDSTTYCRKINIMDVPEKFQSKVLMAEMRKDKANDYEKYLHIWEGEPLGQDPQAIMSRVEVTKAMERNLELDINALVSNGADIAREGDDLITFYKRQGLKIIKNEIHSKLKTPETERRLKNFIGVNKRELTNIDMGNMGSGIHDHLLEDGYNVNGIDFGGRLKVKRPDLYYDVVTEMWFDFADRLNEMDIPNDTKLKSELTKRLFTYRDITLKDGKRRKDYTVKVLEQKRLYKKREGDSPDRADGIVECYYEPKKRRGFIGMSNVGLQ